MGGKHNVGSNARFNWSAFHYKYRDLQVDVLTPGTNVVALQNAASSKNYGVEGDFSVKLDSRLQISIGATWLHAKYGEYPNAAVYLPNVGSRGNFATNIDAKGLNVTHAPKYTVSIVPTYSVPVGTGKVDVTASYLYNDGYFFDPNNRVVQKPYSLLNARIAYRAEADRWSIYAYANNIFDEDIRQGALISEFGDKTQYGDPRVIGVGASVKF